MADVSVREQRLEVFDWIADLDMPLSLLVNNVGTNVRKKTLDYSEEEVRTLIDTNLVSAFEMCRLAYPHLTEHANAAIVNIGSVSGMTHVRTGSPYGMTKAALTQLTRNLACEWAADGIRVNSVAPWYIRTQRTEDVLADPDYLDEVIARTPLDRIAWVSTAYAMANITIIPLSGWLLRRYGFRRYYAASIVIFDFESEVVIPEIPPPG